MQNGYSTYQVPVFANGYQRQQSGGQNGQRQNVQRQNGQRQNGQRQSGQRQCEQMSVRFHAQQPMQAQQLYQQSQLQQQLQQPQLQQQPLQNHSTLDKFMIQDTRTSLLSLISTLPADTPYSLPLTSSHQHHVESLDLNTFDAFMETPDATPTLVEYDSDDLARRLHSPPPSHSKCFQSYSNQSLTSTQRQQGKQQEEERESVVIGQVGGVYVMGKKRKEKKPAKVLMGLLKVACSHCKYSHVACEMARPCKRCIKNGTELTCVDAPSAKRGRPPKSSYLIPKPSTHLFRANGDFFHRDPYTQTQTLRKDVDLTNTSSSFKALYHAATMLTASSVQPLNETNTALEKVNSWAPKTYPLNDEEHNNSLLPPSKKKAKRISTAVAVGIAEQSMQRAFHRQKSKPVRAVMNPAASQTQAQSYVVNQGEYSGLAGQPIVANTSSIFLLPEQKNNQYALQQHAYIPGVGLQYQDYNNTFHQMSNFNAHNTTIHADPSYDMQRHLVLNMENIPHYNGMGGKERDKYEEWNRKMWMQRQSMSQQMSEYGEYQSISGKYQQSTSQSQQMSQSSSLHAMIDANLQQIHPHFMQLPHTNTNLNQHSFFTPPQSDTDRQSLDTFQSTRPHPLSIQTHPLPHIPATLQSPFSLTFNNQHLSRLPNSFQVGFRKKQRAPKVQKERVVKEKVVRVRKSRAKPKYGAESGVGGSGVCGERQRAVVLPSISDFSDIQHERRMRQANEREFEAQEREGEQQSMYQNGLRYRTTDQSIGHLDMNQLQQQMNSQRHSYYTPHHHRRPCNNYSEQQYQASQYNAHTEQMNRLDESQLRMHGVVRDQALVEDSMLGMQGLSPMSPGYPQHDEDEGRYLEEMFATDNEAGR